MRFEKIWVKQCRATKGIRRRFGAKSALDYLIREKLIMFADQAERRPEFAKELPRFLAGIWQVFNQYELAGYVSRARNWRLESNCAGCCTWRDAYSKAGRSSRGISRRIDRPCPGTRSIKPLTSNVTTI